MPWMCVSCITKNMALRLVLFKMFNTTFNNISVISWRSVLLVEETGVLGENHTRLYRVHLAWVGFELKTIMVIGTDCTGSCKSNYHTIMTTTARPLVYK